MTRPGKISLLLADVDGTLVTHDKVLTDRAQRAVRLLREARIRFAITSGRPPKGMAMLIEPLRLDTPIAGFNGGVFVRPDLSIIEERTLAPDVAARTVDLILGHGLEMARGSDATLKLRLADLPFLSQAERLAREGRVTGASHRNWASYGEGVDLPAGLPDWQRHLLTDPQTSGGLLVSCAQERAAELLARIQAAGYPSARIIGSVEAGAGRVVVG